MEKRKRKHISRSYLGKQVEIIIDRPIGSRHPQYDDVVYPINYGYIPDTLSGDGEELDIYLMGVDEPLTSFSGRIIGIIHRKNDVEDELVAAPEGRVFHQAEIAQAVYFTERFFESRIESLYEKSCGTVPFTKVNGVTHYLLIAAPDDGYCGFPKGHMERGESEEQTALRETYEETSVNVTLVPGFRQEIAYQMEGKKTKSVVYFPAEYSDQTPEHHPGFEHLRYMSLPYEQAMRALTYDNTRQLLTQVDAYLRERKE